MNGSFNPEYQTQWFIHQDKALLEMHRRNEAARLLFFEPLQQIVTSELASSGMLDTAGLLLEVGCGAGYFSRYLAPDNISDRLVGIDVNEASLHVASRSNPGGIYLRQDANRMNFSDGHFSGVIGYSSLDSLPDLSRVLTEIKRVAVSGAPLLLLQDCRVDLYNPFGLLSDDDAIAKYHRALVAACKKAGMDIDFEGNVEHVSVLPRDEFVQRVDRELYPHPDPKDILAVADNCGGVFVCADSASLGDFQGMLQCNQDLKAFAGNDGVVQWVRMKVVRGRFA